MQNKNRQSIRLQNYDYSSSGLYFITICTKDRIECLGQVKNGKMIMNNFGKIIHKYLQGINDFYENVFLDTHITMPNHLHLIIEITVGAIHELPVHEPNRAVREPPLRRRKMLIPKIIGKFKMMSAKEINNIQNAQGQSFWQRNYYEHIIRNECELNRVREYIQTNPEMWERDRNNAENLWM